MLYLNLNPNKVKYSQFKSCKFRCFFKQLHEHLILKFSHNFDAKDSYFGLFLAPIHDGRYLFKSLQNFTSLFEILFLFIGHISFAILHDLRWSECRPVFTVLNVLFVSIKIFCFKTF